MARQNRSGEKGSGDVAPSVASTSVIVQRKIHCKKIITDKTLFHHVRQNFVKLFRIFYVICLTFITAFTKMLNYNNSKCTRKWNEHFFYLINSILWEFLKVHRKRLPDLYFMKIRRVCNIH